MMTNENDTDPLTAPPPRDETDPNYPGRTGERVSYGSISHPGLEPHVRTDPNFLTALKETEAQRAPHVVPPPPVAIAEAPKPSGKNDSIDELIDGLPLDASMPKKSSSSALPKAAVPSAPLPPVIVDVKTEPPRNRKGRVDNSTVVTPAGLELKTQRWMTAGIAVAVGLAILVWMINWSAGPSRKIEEPEITTTETQHPIMPPPTLTALPPIPPPPVVENAPVESAPVPRPRPAVSAASPTTSPSARPPRVPASASATSAPASAPTNPDLNDFKPSIRH